MELASLTKALERILYSFKRGFRERCFYYDQRPVRLFGAGEAASPGRLALIILSRRHYFESVQELPINNSLELRQAIALMPKEGPFRGPTLYQTYRMPNGGHRVFLWTLRHDLKLLEGNSSLRLLLPESAALRRLALNDLDRFDGPHGSLFLSQRQGGMRSLYVPYERSGLLSQAAHALGSSREELQELASRSLVPSLQQAIASLTLRDLIAFLRFERKKVEPFPWRSAGLLAAAGLAAYLIVVSSVLWARGAYLEHALASRAEKLEVALMLEQETRALENHLNALQMATNEAPRTWPAWPVLTDLLESGMTLRTLRLENGRMTIFGTGSSATALLEKVVDHPNARDASFAQPVRQQAGGEQFAIVFTPVGEETSP